MRNFEAKDYSKSVQAAARIAKTDIDAPTFREDALQKLIAVSIPMYQAE